MRQSTFRNVHLVDVAHVFLVLCPDPTCERSGDILFDSLGFIDNDCSLVRNCNNQSHCRYNNLCLQYWKVIATST